MYQYDAANRLEQLNGQSIYTFDNNGNLLNSDTLTNTFNAANRLIETERAGSTLEPIYNGGGDRIAEALTVAENAEACFSGLSVPPIGGPDF